MKARSKTALQKCKTLKNNHSQNKYACSLRKLQDLNKKILPSQNGSSVKKINKNRQSDNNIFSQLAIFCLTLLQIQKLKYLQLLKESQCGAKQNLFQQQKYNKFDVKVLYQFIFIQLKNKGVHSRNQNQVLVYYILSTLIDQNLATYFYNDKKTRKLEYSEQQALKIVINDLLIQFYRQKKWITKYLTLKKVRLQHNQHLSQEIMYQAKKMIKIIKLNSNQNHLNQQQNCMEKQLNSISFLNMVKFINIHLKYKEDQIHQHTDINQSRQSTTINQIRQVTTTNQNRQGTDIKYKYQKSYGFNSKSFQRIKHKLINHFVKLNRKEQDIVNLEHDSHNSKKFIIQTHSLAQIVFRLIQSPKVQIQNSYSKTYRKIYSYMQNAKLKELSQSQMKQNFKLRNKHLQQKLIQYIDIKRQAQNHFKIVNPISNTQNSAIQLMPNKQIKSKQTSIETTARCINISPSISDINKKQIQKLQQAPIKNLNFNVVQEQQQKNQFNQILLQRGNKYQGYEIKNRQSPSFNLYSNQKQDYSYGQTSAKSQNNSKKLNQMTKTNNKMNKYEIVEQLFKIRQLRRSIHDNFFYN